jgi:hypothetical protein
MTKEIIENEFIKLIKSFNIKENDIPKILDSFEFLKLEKGKKFLELNEISNKIGLLFYGMLIAYSLDENNEKLVSRFYFLPENSFVVNFESYLQNSKSDEIIEVQEECCLMTISKEKLELLYKEFPVFNNVGRQIAEESYTKALKKIKILQTAKAKERILELKKQNPELFNKFSNISIASYLGMHRNTYNKEIKTINFEH